MIDSSKKTLGRIWAMRNGATNHGMVLSFKHLDYLRDTNRTLRRKKKAQHRKVREARRVNR